MLKFLTHKLRTHSLNEDDVSEKVEERDSGTESDDEADRDSGDLYTDVIMKWNDVTDISLGASAGMCACACAVGRAPPPEPDHLYDHHSSEEELEVINGAPGEVASAAGVVGTRATSVGGRRRGASSPPRAAPGKRRWPVHYAADADDDLSVRPPSSDDDDTKVETPVRFRTSPPREALKPRRSGAAVGGSAPCPAPSSPRRRRAPPPAPRRPRPALDFDKMQQLKVGGGVRAWRAGGAHAGELSVFCW